MSVFIYIALIFLIMMRFEVLSVVNIDAVIIWVVTTCNVINSC